MITIVIISMIGGIISLSATITIIIMINVTILITNNMCLYTESIGGRREMEREGGQRKRDREGER